jgi:sugar lactone lactonase YvrE
MNRVLGAACLLTTTLVWGQAPVYRIAAAYRAPAEAAKARSFWTSFKRVVLGDGEALPRWGQPMSVLPANGLLAVAASGEPHVWLLDPRARSVRRAAPPGGFGAPIDLAASADALFVSDSQRGAVWQYAFRDGAWTLLPLRLLRPTGLHYSKARKGLLITDTGAHTLWVWDGTMARPVRESGLNFPTDVAEAGPAELVVADAMDHQVEILGWDGKSEAVWGEAGSQTGQFAFIRSIAVDRQGRIYVSDVQQNWIQVFDRSGQLLTVLGEGDLFNHPSYLQIQEQTLWVADSFNQRIVEIAIDEP